MISLLECWCNGLLNCVPFTYQKICFGDRYILTNHMHVGENHIRVGLAASSRRIGIIVRYVIRDHPPPPNILTEGRLIGYNGNPVTARYSEDSVNPKMK